MRCCVLFCRNTTDNVSTSEGKDQIAFYGFPNEVNLRAAWLRALGKQDIHLPDSAVVCSQHFLDDEIYETESGLRQIYTGAIPSTVQVCMICLDTDGKLFLMSKHKLDEVYETLTGYPLFDLGNLKQTVCVLCAQKLSNFSRYIAKSLRARSLLMDLVEKHELITKQHIKKINRVENQLKYNFVQTTLGPDHCDSYIVEPDGNKQIVTEETVCGDDDIVIVKNEGSYDSVVVDEHNEETYEDDDLADNVQDEFVVDTEEYSTSDLSILLDAKILDDDLLKALQRRKLAAEQAARTQGPIKCESADDDDEHMKMHLQNGDGDSSQVCEPASSSCDSSHVAENKHGIQKLNDDPSANLTRTLDTAVQTDTNQKIIELDNQSSDSNNKGNKNMNRLTNCVVKLYDVFTNSLKVVPRRADPPAKARNPDSFCGSQNIDISSTAFRYQTANKNEDSATQSEPNRSTGVQSETECLNNDINKEFTSLPDNALHIEKKRFTCALCCKTLNRKSILVKHIKTHNEVKHMTSNTEVIKMTTCNVCQYKTKSNNLLTVHMKTHTGEKPYSCKLCKYKSVSNSKLVQHMKTHSGEKPYSCNLCKYKSARNSNLVLHMRTHTGEKPFSCKLCKYKCLRNCSLVRHMRTHTGEKPYSCNLCKYKSVKNSNLVEHMKTHSGEKPYSCKLCKYKSARNSNLVLHMRTHTGEKPFSCKLCKYKCLRNCSLVRHMRTHTGEKPYSCNLCKYKSVKNSNLVEHMKTHSGEKPYSCKLCKYKSARNSNLVLHMRTHTGEKPFSCKLCKYKSATNNNLVLHMRTHTGEKPYSCKLCKYKSATNSNLVLHMRTHTGEKPFSCKLCKYKCVMNSNLVRHMRTHTGEKPFSCKLCKYKSATNYNLVLHMQTHTGEKPFSCL